MASEPGSWVGALCDGRVSSGSRARWLAPLALVLSCASGDIRRFPLRDPLWVDPDARSIPAKPAKRKAPGYAQVIDLTVLRPLSHGLTLPTRTESVNVNSLDEVPNSSWFTNRIGIFPMTPEQAAKGACGATPPLDPAAGPWTVLSGKTDGGTPGMVIKAADGQRYVLKVDGLLRPQTATAADVIGSRIYYAAGFNSACNEIVYFRDDQVRLDAGATRKDRYGREIPMSQEDLDGILRAAWRRNDGLVRFSASRMLEGTPIGPPRYEGTRPDDPNDVIPHEQRRELRASMLLAAWIHHWDIVEANALDVVIEKGGTRFVRHHILDWSDALGSIGWVWKRLDRRVGIGRSGYVEFDQALVDLVTLGLYPRPWYQAPSPAWPETFGYFGTEGFVPSKWRPTYGNAAFRAMTPRDALWAVRIIARFSDAHVAAIVREAKLDDPAAESYLVDTLIRRRDIILREYLKKLSPLDRFALGPGALGKDARSLCFEDLAIATGVTPAEATTYTLHFHAGRALERLLGWQQLRPERQHPSRTCVALPIGHARPSDLVSPSAPDDDPLRYGVLEIYNTERPAMRPNAGVALHFYDLGPARGFRLVGIERPDDVKDPP